LGEHFYETVIVEQKYLEKGENLQKLIRVFRSILEQRNMKDFIDELEKKSKRIFEDMTLSEERWRGLTNIFTSQSKSYKEVWEIFIREVTLGLLYPRIDSHVSAQVNHLLKCPFNVHHDTGKLSLPILDVKNFDVAKCPTIFDVLDKEGDKIMEPYLAAFDDFCRPLVRKEEPKRA